MTEISFKYLGIKASFHGTFVRPQTLNITQKIVNVQPADSWFYNPADQYRGCKLT